MKSISSTLSFSFYSYKDTCDILSENVVSHRFQAYSSTTEGGVLRYINKDESRHVIGISTICGSQNIGEKGF